MKTKINNLYLCSFASPDLKRSKQRFIEQAKKINMKINEFSKLCKRVKGEDKDNFNLGYFKRFDKTSP